MKAGALMHLPLLRGKGAEGETPPDDQTPPESGEQAVAVVLGFKQKDLYKSMTTNADHKIWQDVYHATLKSGLVAYIKVTMREDGAVVIQFKEK